MRCIDTSFLIESERDEELRRLLNRETFVVPAMAAAEFLVGLRLVKNERVRQRGQSFYDDHIRPFVFSFDEAQAQHLASLIAGQRKRGKTIKPYDAAIAAAALELNCPLLAGDSDFDDVEGLEVIKIKTT